MKLAAIVYRYLTQALPKTKFSKKVLVRNFIAEKNLKNLAIFLFFDSIFEVCKFCVPYAFRKFQGITFPLNLSHQYYLLVPQVQRCRLLKRFVATLKFSTRNVGMFLENLVLGTVSTHKQYLQVSLISKFLQSRSFFLTKPTGIKHVFLYTKVCC